MVIKLLKKLFNIVLVSARFEYCGDRIWLVVALVYVLCCVVGGEVDGVEVNEGVF